MSAAKLLWYLITNKSDPRNLIIEFLTLQIMVLKRTSTRPHLTDAERAELGRVSHQMGPLMSPYAHLVNPETFKRWNRDFQSTEPMTSLRLRGRPRIRKTIEALILRMARENEYWGFGRILGELKKLSIKISKQTIGNILLRNQIPTSPFRSGSEKWGKFIKSTAHALIATDFLSTTIWSGFRPMTFYILFFIDLKTRRVTFAGMTHSPDEQWMMQVARNITSDLGPQLKKTYLIHDRDTKYTKSFDQIFKSFNILPLKLPPQSPNLNAYAERWIQSLRNECLNFILPINQNIVRHVINEYIEYYNSERPHQGIDHQIPLSPPQSKIPYRSCESRFRLKSRLGGLLNSYSIA